MDNLLTPNDVSKILKVSRYTVYEMIKSGVIKAHRINTRVIRVMENDLYEYIKSCEIRGNEVE